MPVNSPAGDTSSQVTCNEAEQNLTAALVFCQQDFPNYDFQQLCGGQAPRAHAALRSMQHAWASPCSLRQLPDA